MRAVILLLIGLCFCSGANAQSQRDLCPARPGLGTPPCIVDAGRTLIETGLADFTHDRSDEEVTDTFVAGDILIRLGITQKSEVQLGFVAFGTQLVREAEQRSRTSGIGDVTLAFKQSLANPDGSSLSAAAQAYISLPTGGDAIGSGDWSVGALLPVSVPLGEWISIQFTPGIEAAVDEDRKGRHLSFGAVAGLGIDITDAVSLSIEGAAVRDEDPSGHTTELLGSASIASTIGENLQLDIGSVFGLNREAPDIQVYLGISRRF